MKRFINEPCVMLCLITIVVLALQGCASPDTPHCVAGAPSRDGGVQVCGPAWYFGSDSCAKGNYRCADTAAHFLHKQANDGHWFPIGEALPPGNPQYVATLPQGCIDRDPTATGCVRRDLIAQVCPIWIVVGPQDRMASDIIHERRHCAGEGHYPGVR